MLVQLPPHRLPTLKAVRRLAGSTGTRQSLQGQEPDGSMVLVSGLAVGTYLAVAAGRVCRRASGQRRSPFRPARTAVGAVDSAVSWQTATPDALGPLGRGFNRICIADARSLLGVLWEPLQATLGELPCGATLAMVADTEAPPVLVRRVKDGEHSWPIMQEGKS